LVERVVLAGEREGGSCAEGTWRGRMVRGVARLSWWRKRRMEDVSAVDSGVFSEVARSCLCPLVLDRYTDKRCTTKYPECGDFRRRAAAWRGSTAARGITMRVMVSLTSIQAGHERGRGCVIFRDVRKTGKAGACEQSLRRKLPSRLPLPRPPNAARVAVALCRG
jgi:hypothetical protein